MTSKLCVAVYLFGSVEEVARSRNISRRLAPDPEGGLETKAHPHTQGNMCFLYRNTLEFTIVLLLTNNSICFSSTANPSCVLFQEGSITQVVCCPHDEDFIAVATRSESLHEVKKSLHAVWLCLVVFARIVHSVSLLQSGSGGGVGAAAGAARSSRESQRVLGAQRSGHHCTLLGHQHAPSFRWGRRRQGVLSACRILQAGQGSDC